MAESNKKNIVLSIICFTFSIILLIIGFIVPLFVDIDIEVNTNEFEGTFVNVEKKTDSYLISVEEYSCKLFVDSNVLLANGELSEINIGEKIYFKIIKTQEKLLENPKIEQIFVVSLRTESRDFVTLESYANNEKNKLQIIKTSCVIGSTVLACIGVLNVVILFKIVKNKKKIKR